MARDQGFPFPVECWMSVGSTDYGYRFEFVKYTLVLLFLDPRHVNHIYWLTTVISINVYFTDDAKHSIVTFGI